jgi:hypothetical protein
MSKENKMKKYSFWFSKEIGKALPICSLLYHTVEIVIDIP